MEKIRLIYLTLILFCCCQLSAQNKTVTGQVTAAGSEEPIIGASVVVRGTSMVLSPMLMETFLFQSL